MVALLLRSGGNLASPRAYPARTAATSRSCCASTGYDGGSSKELGPSMMPETDSGRDEPLLAGRIDWPQRAGDGCQKVRVMPNPRLGAFAEPVGGPIGSMICGPILSFGCALAFFAWSILSMGSTIVLMAPTNIGDIGKWISASRWLWGKRLAHGLDIALE